MEQFKNLHKGKRCFVIGNGPSLNQLDLSLLKNEITFGCNHIYLMKNFKPTYWCMADYWVMERIKEEVQKAYPDVTKFSVKTHHDKTLTILPNTYSINGFKDLYDLNSKPNFSDDLIKGVYGGYSIIYIMIQIAHYLGCNPIYILGIDGFKGPTMKNFFPEKAQFDWKLVKHQTDLSHIAFKTAREFLEGKGIKIYNATPNSAVESFAKVNYEGVLNGNI